MQLKNLEFSDLILTINNPNACFLKGTAGKGLALVNADKSLHQELAELSKVLLNAYENQDFSLSLRINFNELNFRVAVYNDVVQGKVFFLRKLPSDMPDFLKLGLPNPVSSWLLKPENTKGLLLFSGSQASGKTTSATALIAARLAKYGGHGITYEHPVEMPLTGAHGEGGFCFQTEIASEAELPSHVERSHRYGSPNIVFVGEIRTKHAASEVLRIALGSSQQLVVATIHGITLTAALERLLTWAKEADGAVSAQNLAQTLTGIVHQELVFNDKQSKPVLNVKEFLLLAFDQKAEVVRAKLRDSNLFLDDNIREQRNRIVYDGAL